MSAGTPSLLMVAGYTLKELVEFAGHADLQMVDRYVNRGVSVSVSPPAAG